MVVKGRRPGVNTLRRLQQALDDAGYEVELVFDDPEEASRNLHEALIKLACLTEADFCRPVPAGAALTRGEKRFRKRIRGW